MRKLPIPKQKHLAVQNSAVLNLAVSDLAVLNSAVLNLAVQNVQNMQIALKGRRVYRRGWSEAEPPADNKHDHSPERATEYRWIWRKAEPQSP